MPASPPNTYIHLIQYFADQLGTAQLPLNDTATSPVALIDASAMHVKLLQRVLARLYVENGANTLASPISLYACLDALGKERRRLVEHHADYDEVMLIDHLGSLLLTYFEPDSA